MSYDESICRFCGSEMGEHELRFFRGVAYIRACPDWGEGEQ